MQLSDTISKLSGSPTVALNAKAKQLRESGADVLNFTVGEPDFDTPEIVVEEAIAALRRGDTKYGPAGGGLPFRKSICDKLARENGLEYTPDQIVCGTGSKELLLHIFLSIVNPGDEVLLSAPCWVSYKEQIKAAGGIPVIVPMPESGPMVTSEHLESYATDKTVAVVLCSPNNPGGYALTPTQLGSLGAFLAQKDWWVISDEIYEYMTWTHEHVSIGKACPNLLDQLIVVNGMAKGYAMTGWRVGYAAGPVDAIKRVRILQSHSSTCLPPFIEVAARKAIDAGRSLMEDEIKTLESRKELAKTCVEEIPDLGYLEPEGAFYLFVDVRTVVEKSPKLGSSMELAEYLLSEHHVAVVPGEAFEVPGWLRFSYACGDETLKEGFRRLKSAVSDLT